MDDFFFLAEKNEIDGKHHADGMDTAGGNDPKAAAQAGPAFGLSEEPDQPTQIAIGDGCFGGDECFPRLVVDIDCASWPSFPIAVATAPLSSSCELPRISSAAFRGARPMMTNRITTARTAAPTESCVSCPLSSYYVSPRWRCILQAGFD